MLIFIMMCRILDNADWLRNLDQVQFVSDIGRHFRVGIMLSRTRYLLVQCITIPQVKCESFVEKQCLSNYFFHYLC